MNHAIERRRIFSHLTKTRFLHIEDSLSLGKLRFFMGAYERGKGIGEMGTAYAFMDLLDARVVLSDMSWGKAVEFVDFKGGKNGDGDLIARALKIQTREAKYWIQLQNGPGQSVGEGIIKPVGGAGTEISMPMTIFEGRKLAHACLAYIAAWDVFGLQTMPHRENGD
jgi:hypothetical protein